MPFRLIKTNLGKCVKCDSLERYQGDVCLPENVQVAWIKLDLRRIYLFAMKQLKKWFEIAPLIIAGSLLNGIFTLYRNNRAH